MSRHQLVSVIMPVYNREGLLQQTLASVAAQTYQPFEVIIIDDGSTDHSAAAAAEALKSLNLNGQVKTISNRGPDRARDAGMQLAQGDSIALLDSDDLWSTDYLNVMVDAVNALKTDGLVFCDFHEVDNNLESIGLKSDSLVHLQPAETLTKYQILEDNLFEYLLQEQPIFPSALVFRRTLYDRFGTFAQGLPEFKASGESGEWNFFLRCAYSCPGLYVRDPLVKIRKHNANLSSDFADQTASEIQVLRSVAESLPLSDEQKALVNVQRLKRSVDCGYHYFADYRLKAARPYFLQAILSRHCLYALTYLCLSLLPLPLLRKLRNAKAGLGP